jgi:8-oxo-dGTP pyrophosphatase MutT (NUDIX family)
MGAGFLPTTIYNGQLYFLFGKENIYADTPGYADFGGGTDNNESFMETAIREFTEETTGFFGNKTQVTKYVKKQGTFIINYEPKSKGHTTYRTYILPIQYNPYIVEYYNNNHAFLKDKLPTQLYKNAKYLEKSELRWFSLNDIKKNNTQFRPFYKNILKLIIHDSYQIKHFVQSSLSNKNNKKQNRTFKKKYGTFK